MPHQSHKYNDEEKTFYVCKNLKIDRDCVDCVAMKGIKEQAKNNQFLKERSVTKSPSCPKKTIVNKHNNVYDGGPPFFVCLLITYYRQS